MARRPASLCLVPFLCSLAAGASADGRALAAEAFANHHGHDHAQRIELRSGQQHRVVQIVRMRGQGALVRILAPENLRGTALLLRHDGPGEQETGVIYLPAFQKSRPISIAQKADRFFGAITYEDIAPRRIEDFDVESLGTRSGCRLLRLVPRAHARSSYARIDACVDPERPFLRWLEMHPVQGTKMKRLVVERSKVEFFDGVWLPRVSTIQAANGEATRLEIVDYWVVRRPVPPALLSQTNLEMGDADHDLRRLGIAPP